MAGQKSSTVGRKGLLFGLMVLTVLYQVAYQVMMWRALQEEASEEECSAVVGAAPSRQCLEVQLFRSWHESTLEDRPALQVGRNGSDEGGQVISGEFGRVVLGRAELREHFEERRRKLLESHLKSEEALLAGLDKEIQTLVASKRETHNTATWARELGDLRHKLQDGEWKAFVNVLNDSTAPAGLLEEGTTNVAQPVSEKVKRDAVNDTEFKSGRSGVNETKTWLSLSESIEQLHRELCEDPERRGRKICSDYLASLAEKAKKERARVHASRAALNAEIRHELQLRTAAQAQSHGGDEGPARQQARRGLRGSQVPQPPEASAEDTEWSQMFRQMVRQSEREMCEEPHRRDRPDCVKLLAEIEGAERLEAASAELKAELQKAAEDHKTWERKFEEKVQRAHMEMCKENRRHTKDCEEFLVRESAEPVQPTQEVSTPDSADSAEPETWSHAFMHQLHQAEREMCLAPHRRNRPDCVELMAAIEKSEQEEDGEQRHTPTKGLLERSAWLAAQVKTAEEGHAEWERNFEEKVRSTHRELCNDPLRRDRPDCAEFLAESAVVDDNVLTPTAPQREESSSSSARTSSLRQGRRQLRWDSVVASSKGGGSGSWFSGTLRGATTPLGSGQLEATSWVGVVPTVACITAVPRGATAKLMEEVVNNFRSQSYAKADGSLARLVLVYHFRDEGAEDLVRRFADGVQVQGLAAREEHGEFPSAATLRFGAWWAAKGDVQAIAHWAFSANHDPRRLSLQLRALAFSSQPACTLSRNTIASSAVWEETLLGEAKWMREHWYPLMEGQRLLLEGLVGDSVVEVSVGRGQR